MDLGCFRGVWGVGFALCFGLLCCLWVCLVGFWLFVLFVLFAWDLRLLVLIWGDLFAVGFDWFVGLGLLLYLLVGFYLF